MYWKFRRASGVRHALILGANSTLTQPRLALIRDVCLEHSDAAKVRRRWFDDPVCWRQQSGSAVPILSSSQPGDTSLESLNFCETLISLFHIQPHLSRSEGHTYSPEPTLSILCTPPFTPHIRSKCKNRLLKLCGYWFIKVYGLSYNLNKSSTYWGSLLVWIWLYRRTDKLLWGCWIGYLMS